MDRRLAEGLDDEVLGRPVLGAQRDQVVEIAQRHACRILAAQPLGQVGQGLHRTGREDAAFGALVEDFDQRLVDNVGHFIDEQRDAPVNAQVVAHAGARRLVGQGQGADGRGDGGIGQGVQAHVEHMAGPLDLLEIHDGPGVVRIEGIGREAAAQVARSQHRQDGQQVGGDLLVVLAIVAEGAHLGVDHLVALVLGDVVLVVSDEGHQVGAGCLRRPLQVAAMGIVQQLLHLG